MCSYSNRKRRTKGRDCGNRVAGMYSRRNLKWILLVRENVQQFTKRLWDKVRGSVKYNAYDIILFTWYCGTHIWQNNLLPTSYAYLPAYFFWLPVLFCFVFTCLSVPCSKSKESVNLSGTSVWHSSTRKRLMQCNQYVMVCPCVLCHWQYLLLTENLQMPPIST